MALGEMGMTLAGFDSLTPYEFNQAMIGYRDKSSREVDNQLWQTRFLAAMTLTASRKFKKMVRPRDLFKLPGEKLKQAEKAVVMSPEELKKNIEELNRRANKSRARGAESGGRKFPQAD